MAKLMQARCLVAIAMASAAADDILESDEATIKSLARDGQVDPHKDAVAYAKGRGARVVTYVRTDVIANAAARLEALQGELHELEAQMQAMPPTDPGGPALAEKLNAARQALADFAG